MQLAKEPVHAREPHEEARDDTPVAEELGAIDPAEREQQVLLATVREDARLEPPLCAHEVGVHVRPMRRSSSAIASAG